MRPSMLRRGCPNEKALEVGRGGEGREGKSLPKPHLIKKLAKNVTSSTAIYIPNWNAHNCTKRYVHNCLQQYYL